MDFVSNRTPQIEEMLAAIGVADVKQLYTDIPSRLLLPPPLQEDGLSEYEGMRLMEALAETNRFSDFENYLGAGAYEHHTPSLVQAVCSRSEFLTAYTPYQAEASQGILQIIFEFQSAIAALTGLEVANASVYDGAAACAEAILMAMRLNKGRRKIVLAHTLHPHYRRVIDLYLKGRQVETVTIASLKNGCLDLTEAEKLLDSQTAALLVQSPNFLGILEETAPLSQLAKKYGVLTILCANPLAYGLFASAQEQGADIAVGDCQPFGMPLNFGGPYAGYMACRRELVRQLPGRLVGQTVDRLGKEGYVLTLQAREQYIRREKATSNICTNQTLCALAALITICWYGKEGLRKLALTNFRRAAYLRDKLAALDNVRLFTEAPCFNEFVIHLKESFSTMQKRFQKKYISPGVHLGDFFSEWPDHLLIAVTETKNREQLDRYCEAMGA